MLWIDGDSLQVSGGGSGSDDRKADRFAGV
jgi:hypothetical protein